MKKRKVIHYGKKFTVLVCVALTLTITGCSEKSEESGVMVDKIENVQSENQNEGGQEDKKNSEKNEDTEIKKENNNERNVSPWLKSEHKGSMDCRVLIRYFTEYLLLSEFTLRLSFWVTALNMVFF